MKQPHVVYGVTSLGILVLLLCLIGYIRDTRPTQTRSQQIHASSPIKSSAEVSGEASAEATDESCGCCSKRMQRARKQFRKIREQRKQQDSTDSGVTGSVEGTR